MDGCRSVRGSCAKNQKMNRRIDRLAERLGDDGVYRRNEITLSIMKMRSWLLKCTLLQRIPARLTEYDNECLICREERGDVQQVDRNGDIVYNDPFLMCPAGHFACTRDWFMYCFNKVRTPRSQVRCFYCQVNLKKAGVTTALPKALFHANNNGTLTYTFSD